MKYGELIKTVLWRTKNF